MKNIKKTVCLALSLMFIFSAFASAFALTGTVNIDTWLNLRKSAPSGTIIGYVKDGTTVTILDGGSQTSGFYHITAYSYTVRWTSGGANRTGYGSAAYID